MTELSKLKKQLMGRPQYHYISQDEAETLLDALAKAEFERDEARELESMFNDALLNIVALTDTSMDPALSVKNINEIACVAIEAIAEKHRKASAPPKRRKLGRDADGTPLNIIEPHCGQCAIDPRDGETWCVCGKPPVRLT
jgi:hypothetical protein